MHQESVWQAQLLGFLGSWWATHYCAKKVLERLESNKTPVKKTEEAAGIISKGLLENIMNVAQNPFSFFKIILKAFDPKTESIAFTATAIPCAVALTSHLYQLYLSRLSMR